MPKFQLQNPTENYKLRHRGVYERIILKPILQKWGGGMSSGLLLAKDRVQ
jgi:hypothetical protein